jgi:hypothetical protein
MMCLGWFNQMDCQARPYVTVAGPTQTAAEASGVDTGVSGTSATACDTPWWFWLVGAGVVALGAAKK